jgi:glycosyltransferase involved in cell wall biosynthesis
VGRRDGSTALAVTPELIVVDGRVFGGRATGIQRVARGAFDAARAQGLEARVVAPRGVVDPRVDAHLWTASSRVYEQVALPLHAGGRRVLSLANTAPLLVRHSVVFVHDLATSREPAWFAPRMRLYARAVQAAARRADAVLVPSRAIADELIGTLGLSQPVHVVRPATDLTPADPEAVAATRTRHGLGKPYAVLLGWADPRKDLATALAAHRKAREVVPHDLVLVGSPHPNLAPVPLPPDVVHLGAVTDDELRAVLTGAQVLLHPSRYEGFGLPPLEALACGTPALIGDVPAVREATHDLVPVLPLGDVEVWTTALLDALREPLPLPVLPPWTWADSGRALISALS